MTKWQQSLLIASAFISATTMMCAGMYAFEAAFTEPASWLRATTYAVIYVGASFWAALGVDAVTSRE